MNPWTFLGYLIKKRKRPSRGHTRSETSQTFTYEDQMPKDNEKTKKEAKGMHWVYKLDPKTRNQSARTPEDLLVNLEEEYGVFDFDPCPPEPDFDGLEREWGKNNFVNPPFNNLKKWLGKAVQEWNEGEKQIIFLMPIRVHTDYFIDTVIPLIESQKVKCFIIRGGVKFRGYKLRAPFGCMYLVFPSSKPE